MFVRSEPTEPNCGELCRQSTEYVSKERGARSLGYTVRKEVLDDFPALMPCEAYTDLVTRMKPVVCKSGIPDKTCNGGRICYPIHHDEFHKEVVMVHRYAKLEDILEKRIESPLPLSVIPNHMGINLCSVDGISWTKQTDGQLVNLTIHFLPADR